MFIFFINTLLSSLTYLISVPNTFQHSYRYNSAFLSDIFYPCFWQLRKNIIAAIPEKQGIVAIFSAVLDYGILFPALTFFLNCFHLAFGDEFIVGVKITDPVQCIGQPVTCIKQDTPLFLYVCKIYCFQFIQNRLTGKGVSWLSFKITVYD